VRELDGGDRMEHGAAAGAWDEKMVKIKAKLAEAKAKWLVRDKEKVRGFFSRKKKFRLRARLGFFFFFFFFFFILLHVRRWLC
jgi:hypothetical protein